MPSEYTFAEYSSAWPELFAREAATLRVLLADELVAVHHIGSTSVPGLPAKPIIDMLPLVRSIERIDEQTTRLENAGYKSWGEYGLAGRRYFTRDRGRHRTHNLHVYQQSDPAIERHLAFCAYLRQHTQIAQEYVAVKREAYARYPADIDAYNGAKNDWIKRIERLAVAWYRQYVPPNKDDKEIQP